MSKRAWWVLLVVGMTTGLMTFGCNDGTPGKEPATTTDVEVHDKLGGGKEIEKKEVIDKGDRVEVRETETEVDEEGRVTEQETKVTGDNE